MAMNEVLNAREVSKEFFGGRISYGNILKRAKTGEIPCVKIGSQYFFHRSRLERLFS